MPINVAKLATKSEALWIVSAKSAVLPERKARNPFPNMIVRFNRIEYKATRALFGLPITGLSYTGFIYVLYDTVIVKGAASVATPFREKIWTC